MTELKNLSEKLDSPTHPGHMRSSFHSLRSDINIQLGNNDEVISTLVKVTIICAAFMLVELVGGYWANSVAVISDALHLTIDIIGYVIQITSAKLAMKSTRTFNLRKHQKDELRLLQVRTYGFSPQLFDHLATYDIPSSRELPPYHYTSNHFPSENHAFDGNFRSYRQHGHGCRGLRSKYYRYDVQISIYECPRKR